MVSLPKYEAQLVIEDDSLLGLLGLIVYIVVKCESQFQIRGKTILQMASYGDES